MANIADETGWLADLIYTGARFESNTAMVAGARGAIVRFSRDPADLAKAQRLSGRAILPGLVNVHSHAFQRVIRGRTEHRTKARRDTFWTWRESMYRAANRLSPDQMYAAARMCFLEMLLSGVTTAGEFHYLHHGPQGVPYANRNELAHQVLRAAADVGLRIVLLRAAYVRAGWRKDPDPGQARFLTPVAGDFLADTERLRSECRDGLASVGVAPHSVRAVPLDYLKQIAAYARDACLPLHMHIAEQPAEVEACLSEYGLRPVELLHEQEILDGRFTGIHGIHITDREVAYLSQAGARIAACPTTERNLGDGIAPADRLLEAGAGICFGTDSNAQIDLLEDARALEYHLRLQKLERAVLDCDASPDGLARRLFRCATETGAESLDVPGGWLAPGRAADFFTIDLNDPSIAGAAPDTLLSNVVFALERTAVRDVCVAGQWVVRNGRHLLQEEILREFGELQRELWGAPE